jgi:hypothetical protein
MEREHFGRLKARSLGAALAADAIGRKKESVAGEYAKCKNRPTYFTTVLSSVSRSIVEAAAFVRAYPRKLHPWKFHPWKFYDDRRSFTARSGRFCVGTQAVNPGGEARTRRGRGAAKSGGRRQASGKGTSWTGGPGTHSIRRLGEQRHRLGFLRGGLRRFGRFRAVVNAGEANQRATTTAVPTETRS